MAQTSRRNGHQPGIGHQLRAAAGTAVSWAGGRISPSSPHPGRPARQTGEQTRSSRRHWEIPVAKQQPFPFNRGNLAQIHDSLPRLTQDSPGAAIAVLHYLHSHQLDSADENREYELERAGGRFVNLVRMHQPTDRTLRAAQSDRTKMKSSTNELGRLTGELIYLEEQYLRFACEQPTQIGLQALINSLAGVADRFEALGSKGRAASARTMTADLCLMYGYIGQRKGKPGYQQFYSAATGHMAKALELMGQHYSNEELSTIAQGASITDSFSQPMVGQPAVHSGPPVAPPVGAGQPDYGTTHDEGLASDQIRP